MLLDDINVMADTCHDLAAVPTGAAIAKVTRLKHHDVCDTRLGKFQPGIDAREAASDHDHVAVDVVRQTRGRRVRR